MSQKNKNKSGINQKWKPSIQNIERKLNYYVEGLELGDRKILAEAITFVESTSIDLDDKLQLLSTINTPSSNSIRLGISGSPGVGKSTFINCLGKHIIKEGKKVAVLAVDPSSNISHGAILGDKTRMYDLSINDDAYVRPSASRNVLGGITDTTKEAILLCEAAGYDVIIIETVGVGQSETHVRNIVDLFSLLILPGAGDELQGIKKGIVEIADIFIINKADGDQSELAKKSKKFYQNALHMGSSTTILGGREVMTCSALEDTGVKEIWMQIQKNWNLLNGSGKILEGRERQDKEWFAQKSKSIFAHWAEKLYNKKHYKSKLIINNQFQNLRDYNQEIKIFMNQRNVEK